MFFENLGIPVPLIFNGISGCLSLSEDLEMPLHLEIQKFLRQKHLKFQQKTGP